MSRRTVLSHPLWSAPWPSLSLRDGRGPGRGDVAGGWRGHCEHCEPAVETRDQAYSRGKSLTRASDTHSLSYREWVRYLAAGGRGETLRGKRWIEIVPKPVL